MSKPLKKLIILFIVLFTGCIDKYKPIDIPKITNETELNFAFSDERGIKSNTGIIYFVEDDNKTLVAIESSKKIIWKVDVIEKCGKPGVGKSEIRYLRLNQNEIYVVFGKHSFANVNIDDGTVEYLGSD